MKSVFSLLFLVMLLSVSAPQQVHAQGTLYGLPARLRGLSDLELTTTDTLTPPQKTEIILTWLVEERSHPSPTTRGISDTPIDTDYIQAQIVKDLELWGDPSVITWVLSSPSLKDKILRDAMVLALGSMGDRSKIAKTESIMLNNPNPFLRAIAAEDLGTMTSASSIPILERAAKDPFFMTIASESHGGKVIDFYPVRQVAGETLRMLRDPKMLKAETLRGQFAAQRLIKARGYKFDPKRFQKILDKSRARIPRPQ